RVLFRSEPTEAETISAFELGYYEDLEYADRISLDVKRLREFYDEIRYDPIECMKLSCGGCVPLGPMKKLANLFLTYPDEGKKWKYSIQFHARGLSVHGDFRIQVTRGQAIGWTWDTGKSLLKPMLKRTPIEQRVKAGLSSSDLNLPAGELSKKVKSTSEGRNLYKALRAKTQELKFETLKAMMDELWTEHVDPVLKDPKQKILTQIKHPMSVEWLDYEEEAPPGAAGATTELEGQFVIMDRGTVEYGAQKSYFHEYWLHGERIKDRRLVIRRLATREKWRLKEAFAWMTFIAKPEQTPYVISKRAVDKDWMPPQGISALPASVRKQIPDDRQFWRAKNAKEIRNALVQDMKSRKVRLRLAERLQFSVKRIWHKGPEVKRGLPVTRYWLLLHSGRKVYDAWDFGQEADPLEEDGILARRRKTSGLAKLLPRTGSLTPRHPVSQTRMLKTHFDTSDTGSAIVEEDTSNKLRIRLSGGVLKGEFIFVKEDGEMWTFKKIELPETKKAMLLASYELLESCPTTEIMHLAAEEVTYDESRTPQMGDLLIISGPAIKPGEVLPMDGKPSFFTKEGIKRFWPSMYRQPIVILHGDLKGDVVGFVDKIHYDEGTGWGWIDRGVIWHPLGIKLILEKKLPSFSIEVIPESVWDPEHKHEHVIGGRCVGLAVVPKGACLTCNPITAQMGSIRVGSGKVYKFGMTTEQFLIQQYWEFGLSTQEISGVMGIPRSTIESWMKKAEIPRRDYQEARNLRKVKELSPRAFITALGTGAFTDIPRDDCPQCKEARAGGRSRRNFTATLFSVGNQHLLLDAPKGIATMLGNKRLRPNYVLIEHIHEDVLGGLHELRALKPVVFATKEIWDWLRRHYRGVSGQKDVEFETLYNFERRVIKDRPFRLGPFTIEAVKIRHAKKGDPSAVGFKIHVGGKVVWHGSDVYGIPDVEKTLKDVDIYIGDGASLRRDISRAPGQGHISIEDQIKWARDAKIPQIYFTQIGHVGKTHEDLNKALKEISPNVQALHDGAEIPIKGGNPGARYSSKIASGILNGERKIIVRAKPYQEYARQAIYLLGEDQIYGLYVEGFPEGPYPADKVRKEMRDEHGLSDKEWKEMIGDGPQVWIYRPRILFKHPEPRGYRDPEFMIGPYVHDVRL
ncbi:MAG: MBL fold metallo-hydrolase, partial [Candidatus Bathyarchaeota archaeon]|nr:MBL fold metallo-hydrolase [Candidatus Bathyarchaeota archaeon]